MDDGPDRAWGDENAYEAHRARASGLCVRCRANAALPDDPDELCRDCILDAEEALGELEDAA